MNMLWRIVRRNLLVTFFAKYILFILLVLCLQSSAVALQTSSASGTSEGVTILRDLMHDTCAAVTAPSANAAVVASFCGAYGDGETFQFYALSDGNTKIYTYNTSTYCLAYSGNTVVSAPCANVPSQEWLVQVVSNGMMLETSDGTACFSNPADWNSSATTMQPCSPAANQVFRNNIIPATSTAPTATATCGATPSGSAVWVSGTTGSSTTPATTLQCASGGSLTTTWTNQSQYLCTNGTLISTGQTQQINLVTTAPVCSAATACGTTLSGGTIWINGTAGLSIAPATTLQCTNGGTVTTTWTNQTQEVCTNGTFTSTGQTQQASLVTAAPVCSAATGSDSGGNGTMDSGTAIGTSGLRDLIHDMCAAVVDQSAGAGLAVQGCSGSTDQTYQFYALSDGHTRIYTLGSLTDCLAYSGNTVVSTTCSNDPAQEWLVQALSNGMMLTTVDGTACLSDPTDWNSSATTMQPCNAAPNQMFQNSIISAGGGSASSSSGGSSSSNEGTGTPTESAVGNVTVLAASQPSQIAPPGATINIGTNFTAVTPLSTSYSLKVYLTDSTGKIVTSVTDTLNDYDSTLPTTQWQGPITIVQSLQVPSVADGTYQVMVALNDASTNTLVALSTAPGVTQDSQYRYAIGTLTVQASAPAPSLLGPQALDLTGFSLTFDDEFQTLDLSDGSLYNGSKWYTHNEQCCMQTTDGTGTYMYGMDDPQNPYSIAPGGGLDIRLQKVNNNWSSGVITSVDSSGVGFSQQYGYFEMSATFPSGVNTWPAFWLLNTASKTSNAAQGEIDVVEYIANPSFINTIRTTLHNWSNNTAPDLTWTQVTNPSDGKPHTYGMLWTAETMKFYFDGTLFFACPTPPIMQQPYYMLVDLGIGSGYPTNTTPAVNDMVVQHVRAYALPPGQ